MEAINITVPEALQEFVQARIVNSGYGSASEYVGELIRTDQKQHALEVLGSEILKGASSGPSVPVTNEDWREIRGEVRPRFVARKSS
jgi:putative addiction module CopG family antidote